MVNKHQIQKDFDTKKKEWKEALKINEQTKKESLDLDKMEEVLFDEEMYPEFKDSSQLRVYYRKKDDLEPDR